MDEPRIWVTLHSIKGEPYLSAFETRALADADRLEAARDRWRNYHPGEPLPTDIGAWADHVFSGGGDETFDIIEMPIQRV